MFICFVSPDHKKLAFRIGRGNLILSEIKDGELSNSRVYSSGWAERGFELSPDSKYIATPEDLNFDSEIFIQSG